MLTRLHRRISETFGLQTPHYLVARRAGVYPERLSEYINGRREMTSSDLVAFCELLKCRPDEIIGTVPEAEYDLT